MLSKLLTASFLAAVLSACASVHYQSQEITLRRDVADDVLFLDLTYHGMMAVEKQTAMFADDGLEMQSEGPDLAKGGKIMGEIARGERVFMILDPILEFRLDDADDPSDPQGESLTGLDRRVADYLDRIRMEEVRIYLEEDQRLTVLQRLSFPDITAGLTLVNETMRRDFLEAHRAGAIHPEQSLMDQATIDLMLADALGEREWVYWVDGGLEIAIPASPEQLAKLLGMGLSELGQVVADEAPQVIRGFAFCAELLAPLSSLTVEKDHVLLRFAMDPETGLHVHVPVQDIGSQFAGEAQAYDPALRDHLVELGIQLPHVWRRAQ